MFIAKLVSTYNKSVILLLNFDTDIYIDGVSKNDFDDGVEYWAISSEAERIAKVLGYEVIEILRKQDDQT